MFSVPDILVVSVLALLLFGPDRLPKLMRQAGRFMREVQNTSHGFISEMERAADLAEHPVSPPSPAAATPETNRYGDSAPSDIVDYVEPDPVERAEHETADPAEPPAIEHPEPAAIEHAEPSSNEHPALRNPPLGGSAI
jgi:TatA/E family protein of Tat protein translocase